MKAGIHSAGKRVRVRKSLMCGQLPPGLEDGDIVTIISASFANHYYLARKGNTGVLHEVPHGCVSDDEYTLSLHDALPI